MSGAADVHAGVRAARTLRAHEVDTVFTLNGGHIWPLYDGCVQEHIRIVDTRHEQSATFAAEGWAKVTRRVGVAALTAGPGVTNGMSAITSAWLNGTPLFVAGGRAPQARWGQGSLQELDHVPLVTPVTKFAATAWTADSVASTYDAALRAVRRPHRGPAFVDVPLDAWGPSSDAARGPVDPHEFRGPVPDPDAMARLASLLGTSTRPILVLGNEVYWAEAEQEATAVAESFTVPTFANDMGRGLLPADHSLAFARARSLAFAEADLVVVAGAPLDFRLGFGRFGEGHAQVVHLADAAAGIARHVPLALSCAADLRAVFADLAAWGPKGTAGAARERARWVERLRTEEQHERSADAARLESGASPIDPVRVYGELRRRLDRDAIVIGDGGDFVSYAGRYIDTYVPGCFLGPGPFGCLGSGLGYAFGAALARPDRQVVVLLGDGAIGFSLGDLDTLARHRVRVVMIVGNNGIWGLEKHPMRALFGYDVVCDLAPETRYDRVAEDLGCSGELVSGPEQLGPALERAFATDGPALVNVLIDPADSYPRRSTLG